MQVKQTAPAKINLGLRILGRRPDGFHDILSLFQTVTLADTLTAGRLDGPRLVCDDGNVPLDGNNLVLRAEDLFMERFGLMERAGFTLEKRIPMGGGLGGGSSDAAAALRALRDLHAVDCADGELAGIAARLGSDVPFLITGGTAFVEGRGERVTTLRLPFDLTYVIVHPGFGVSTAWAYGSLEGFRDDGGRYAHVMGRLASGGGVDVDEFIACLVNDFEPTVFRANPVLSGLKARLLDMGACAAFMTGSGACLVGIFHESGDARVCAERMTEGCVRAWPVKPTGH